MNSFSEWLLQYKRKSIIRDLADDVRSDVLSGDLPEAFTEIGLEKRLTECGACDGAFHALRSAKLAYRRYRVAKI